MNDDIAWNKIPRGDTLCSVVIISSGCAKLHVVMALGEISGEMVSSVKVTYMSRVSCADSVEASGMCLVDQVLRDHLRKLGKRTPYQPEYKESLAWSSTSNRALHAATSTMFGK